MIIIGQRRHVKISLPTHIGQFVYFCFIKSMNTVYTHNFCKIQKQDVPLLRVALKATSTFNTGNELILISCYIPCSVLAVVILLPSEEAERMPNF